MGTYLVQFNQPFRVNLQTSRLGPHDVDPWGHLGEVGGVIYKSVIRSEWLSVK
jgi:hypothetical protein